MGNHNHNENNMLNPFSPQQPAQPDYFAGRKAEVDYFRKTAINSAKLRHPAPLNYAILGSWGLGKTSLIYEFRDIALGELQREIRCVCIERTLSPQTCRSWDAFTSSFLSTVGPSINATSTIRARISSEIAKWEPQFNIGILSAQRKAQRSQPDLLTALKRLWHDHLKPAGTEIAFVLLDDLHYFPIRKDESPYLTLRSTFQELVNQRCNYSLVTTAHSGLFTEIADIAEPMLRFFKPFELKPFTTAETKEAVHKRLSTTNQSMEVDDEVLEEIAEKTEGHPYLIMFTMYEMFTMLGSVDRVRLRDFEKCWPGIQESLGSTIFGQKVRTASEKERQLLVKMANSGEEFASPSDMKQPSELFSRLEKKELLIRHQRGRYSLFHPLFSEYLRKL
ncbi:MAG: hypothetical protein ABSB56_08185 [Nitrososphaerales archaeon]